MEYLIKSLSPNSEMEFDKAIEIKKFFNTYFHETEAIKIDLISNTIAKYPCAITPFYEFCKEVIEVMPEFTSLKSICSIYCALGWWGVTEDFKSKLVIKNFKILNSL